jgi:hypothetical protein
MGRLPTPGTESLRRVVSPNPATVDMCDVGVVPTVRCDANMAARLCSLNGPFLVIVPLVDRLIDSFFIANGIMQPAV